MTDARDPQLTWTDDDAPRSGRFGDVYFSAEDGLAETRAVFLEGCGLPHAWAGRRHFTVAELGFGTGLNIAALLELWSRTRPAGARLHVFSVEAYPMTAGEAARALSRWPDLAEPARALVKGWPARTPGFHRIDLPDFGAVLDLAVMEAGEALAQWCGRADAWFLDGFAPSANPEMWSDEILGLVGARSAAGARAATFTVAGNVRRGLASAGFHVAKRPGFGRKRERLEATAPGAGFVAAARRVAIIGAGIAGAAMVRALRREGSSPILFDAEGAGAGASGNPAALVTPRFDAGGGAGAAFFAQAFERAVAAYDATPEAVIATGALQLEAGDRDAARFDRIAAQPCWNDGGLQRLDACEASAQLTETSGSGGLLIRDGRVIEPATVLSNWIGDTPVVAQRVGSIEETGEGWRLTDDEGAPIAEVDVVVLTAGWGLAELRPDLRLAPARGQVTTARSQVTVTAAAWGGYVVPTRDGLLFGATFDRGDTTTEVRAEDDTRNLDTLAEARPLLAYTLHNEPLSSRARIRATTPDHLPLAGALAPGLWVLGGLGARGFTTAPLLTEHLAAEILGVPSPLPSAFAKILEPSRRSATFAGAGPDLS